MPIVEFYENQDKVYRIDATLTADEVYEKAKELFYLG